MTRKYSMAYLTANGADPDKAVLAAAEAGYDMISFRMLPGSPTDVLPPLMEGGDLYKRTVAAMKDTDVTFADAEMVRIGETFDLDGFTPFFDRIVEMGARHILVAGDDPDRARITENYGRLCERLGPYGLTADLEYMPWTAVKNIADALEMIEAVNLPAAAILFDTLHFDRCSSSLGDIAKIPRDRINYIQICDGPVPYDPSDAGLIHVAREHRLMAGRGGIDLAAIVARLPQDVTVSVEVPDMPLAREMGLTNFAQEALERTKALYGSDTA